MATRAPVQTPGAPVQTPGEPVQTPDTPTPPTPTEGASADDLRAMIEAQQAQLQAMMAAMQQMQANQRAMPAQVQAQALPDMDDLDVDEINRGSTPVLSKQGWIVPPNFGADPVMLAREQQEAEQRAAIVQLAKAAAKKG